MRPEAREFGRGAPSGHALPISERRRAGRPPYKKEYKYSLDSTHEREAVGSRTDNVINSALTRAVHWSVE